MAGPAPTGFQAATAENFGPISFGGPNVLPPFDLIEVLPTAARERLLTLRQRADDAHSLVPSFKTIREASMAKIEAENTLRRLTDPAQYGGFNLKPDQASVKSAERTLDRLTAEFERLQRRSEERSQAWQSASAALRSVEAWLRDGRPHGVLLQDYDGEPPKLVKNETVVDAIERHCRRVRELKADLHRIESACFPSAYCKEQMRAQIEALAQRGTPDLALLIEYDREIVWPTLNLQSTVYNTDKPAIGFVEVVDTAALLAYALKDVLIKKLDAEIDAEADDKSALSHEARQERAAVVQGDLLAVEFDEAALVFRAQSEGLPVEHRADINPVALLGVVLVTAAVNGHAGTSTEHSFELFTPGGR